MLQAEAGSCQYFSIQTPNRERWAIVVCGGIDPGVAATESPKPRFRPQLITWPARTGPFHGNPIADLRGGGLQGESGGRSWFGRRDGQLPDRNFRIFHDVILWEFGCCFFRGSLAFNEQRRGKFALEIIGIYMGDMIKLK